jgi:peptidyl-prolyl cis-trans isomerase A (cyclophilin A)
MVTVRGIPGKRRKICAEFPLTLLMVIIIILLSYIFNHLQILNTTTILPQATVFHSKLFLKPEASQCPVTSFQNLSEEELYPKAGNRHMVDPPKGGSVSLVCCHTTKGPMSFLLHEKWAPLGVARFLDMVKNDYFRSNVPLFRCTDACQFGIAGDPQVTKKFKSRLKDDPMWLPTGPTYRKNDRGIRRYPQGYITYAGSGNNSRTNQFVLTLKPNQFMGGGSPWEVPIGELVGNQSFFTMSKFYTGYGEKGPSQGMLHREGYSDRIRMNWPQMDSITYCGVLGERKKEL